MKDFLSPAQVTTLRLAHKSIRDKKLADRIKAILALNTGFSYEQMATLLLLDEVTLRRYVQKFQEQGVSGLLEYRYHGGRSHLTLIEQNTLETYLVSHTITTAKEVRDHILITYGKKYSLIGINKLLHRMGFTYKKPKVLPGNASAELQGKFLQRYQEIKSMLGKNDHVYFSDATHPTHNTKPSYGWIKKGKKHDRYIKSNTGRKRLNLLGAVAIDNKQVVVIEEETINATAMIHLFEKMVKNQPHGNMYIILDNAKYNHANMVKNWLLNHPRFKPIFLPPYSPNLNLIERLWRFFHQKVTWNHYFETFTDFNEATLTFFNNLKQYQTELSTLLTDNFQLLPT